MVQVDAKIVMCGMICLTIIFLILFSKGGANNALGYGIIGIIGLAMGVMFPSPLVDNKLGVLKW